MSGEYRAGSCHFRFIVSFVFCFTSYSSKPPLIGYDRTPVPHSSSRINKKEAMSAR